MPKLVKSPDEIQLAGFGVLLDGLGDSFTVAFFTGYPLLDSGRQLTVVRSDDLVLEHYRRQGRMQMGLDKPRHQGCTPEVEIDRENPCPFPGFSERANKEDPSVFLDQSLGNGRLITGHREHRTVSIKGHGRGRFN